MSEANEKAVEQVANAITRAAQSIVDIAARDHMMVPHRGTIEMIIRDLVVTPLIATHEALDVPQDDPVKAAKNRGIPGVESKATQELNTDSPAMRAARLIIPDCLSRTCFIKDCGRERCWGCEDAITERKRVAAIIESEYRVSQDEWISNVAICIETWLFEEGFTIVKDQTESIARMIWAEYATARVAATPPVDRDAGLEQAAQIADRFNLESEAQARITAERIRALKGSTAPSGSAWQPIETVPQGVAILLVWADSHVQIEELSDEPSFWFENAPTHWMPLPPAPSAKEEEKTNE